MASDTGPLLGALLRRCHQAVFAEVTRELEAAGYPNYPSAFNAVARPLWDRPEGVRATELAAIARVTKQSMGAIVEQLEALGYVERVDDPSDKRAKLVRLTKRGRAAGRIMRSAVRRVEADWAKRIGAKKVETLRAILIDVLESLQMDA